MHSCMFCGAALPSNTPFCGNCGQIQKANTAINGATYIKNGIQSQPTAHIRHSAQDYEEENQQDIIVPVEPFSGAPFGWGQPNAPMVQGISPAGNAPFVQGGNFPPPTGGTFPPPPLSPSPMRFPPNTSWQAPTPASPPAAKHPSIHSSQPPLQHGAPVQAPAHHHHTTHPGKPPKQAHTPPQRGSSTKPKSRSLVKWLLIAGICMLIITGGTLFAIVRSYVPGTGLSPNTGQNSGTSTCPNSTRASSKCAASTTSTSTSSSNGTSYAPIHMTLSGTISGPMIMKSNDEVMCGITRSNSDVVYEVSGIGTINGTQYTFLAAAGPYTKPQTYTATQRNAFTRTTLTDPHATTTSNDPASNWSTNAGSMNMTINSDGKSGVLDATLLNSTGHAPIHISGNWTCGTSSSGGGGYGGGGGFVILALGSVAADAESYYCEVSRKVWYNRS